MHPKNRSTREPQDRSGCSRSDIAFLCHIPARQRPDETLARRAGKNRQTKSGKFTETGHQRDIFAFILGKSKAGIEHHGIKGNARSLGDFKRAIEEFKLIVDDVGKLA